LNGFLDVPIFIGRTPLRLFDPKRANPFLFKAGDLLKFEPISMDEYHDIDKAGAKYD